MLSCALDDDGRRVQRARYTRLAASVAHLERTPEAVVIEFDEQVHRETLERALAVERQCCPFFIFDFDPPPPPPLISVPETEPLPAPAAIADAFRRDHSAPRPFTPARR